MITDFSNVGTRPSQLIQTGSMNNMTAIGTGGDADKRSGGGPPPGGPMLDAITQTLSQLGFGNGSSTSTTGVVTTVASLSSTNTSSDAKQALSAFAQNLIVALYDQSSQASGYDSAGTSDRGSGARGVGYRADFQADLNSLMTQVATADSGSSTSSSAAGSSLTKLRESFQDLVSAFGGSGSDVTLSAFLQKFAGNMSGASPSGNIISEKA